MFFLPNSHPFPLTSFSHSPFIYFHQIRINAAAVNPVSLSALIQVPKQKTRTNEMEIKENKKIEHKGSGMKKRKKKTQMKNQTKLALRHICIKVYGITHSVL